MKKTTKQASRKAPDQPAPVLDTRIICSVIGCNARAERMAAFSLLDILNGNHFWVCPTHRLTFPDRSQVAFFNRQRPIPK